MKLLKKIVVTLGFALFVAAPVFSVAVPQTTHAISSTADCEVRILGIPPWYKGLVGKDSSNECSVVTPGAELNGAELELSAFIWRIALNIIEIALFIVGYISVFFVLYGGFLFLTGGDNASKVESARKTILNALIGLGISIGSVVVVNLIFGIIE